MSVEVQEPLKDQINLPRIKEEAEKTVAVTSEPLKIPLPKFQRTIKVTNNAGSSFGSPINSSSFGDSTIADKTEKQLILNCDSPQIFSLNNEIEVEEEEVAAGGEVGDKEKAGGNGNNLRESAKLASDFGTGYREPTGVSSGFNSDLDSDEGSPFYSSDIDSDTSSDPPLLWNFADYFSNLPGNDWCVRIPQCFIEDEFNLFELPDVFKCPLTLTDFSGEEKRWDEYAFDDLIDFITIEDLTEDPIPKISSEMLEDSILLYKLIHQRFIMTKAGLQAIWEKFEQQTYGTCPRYYCHDQPLLPVGPSALPGRETVKVYCLHCQDLYQPTTQKHSKIDGVPFGPSFAHFFVRTLLYANESKAIENRRGSHDWQVFIPKIYGFRIHRQGEAAEIRKERPTDFK